ncbi:MAG TPA: transglutaminase family protein [Ginsengibacter sp.]
MPSYKIKHITRYSYSSTVIDCTNQIMLYPIIDGLLEVRNHQVKISYDPVVESFIDYFGNHVGVFSVIKPHTGLLIESIADVITKPIIFPIDDMSAAPQWEILRNLKYHTAYMDFLKPEIFISYDEVKNILNDIISEEKTPLQNAIAFSEYVYNNFTYQKGITSVETKTEDVLKLKAGVCQDFAHILIIFLRMFEIPSRYVSGYICPKDKEMRGEGATHAWVEAYIPNYGWLGLDPTNNCIVNDQHVRLATGRNFTDCTPVKGTYKGSGEHILEVSVEIKNGTTRKTSEKQGLPKFSYQAKNPGEPINSYRYYLEVQQKQQQQ